MSLQWCLGNTGRVRGGGRIVVCPDSSFAISRVSSQGKVKAHATYVQHLRELLKSVKDTFPTVTVIFHKVEGHSVRDDREARGNNRVDTLAKSGAESYVSIPLPRPRLPPSVASRSVRTPSATVARNRRRPDTDTPLPTPSIPSGPDTAGAPHPPGAFEHPEGAFT